MKSLLFKLPHGKVFSRSVKIKKGETGSISYEEPIFRGRPDSLVKMMIKRHGYSEAKRIVESYKKVDAFWETALNYISKLK